MVRPLKTAWIVMSLASYRAAPPRAILFGALLPLENKVFSDYPPTVCRHYIKSAFNHNWLVKFTGKYSLLQKNVDNCGQLWTPKMAPRRIGLTLQ